MTVGRTKDPWIELRDDGKLWAKYHPELRLLEMAKGKLKVVFDLKIFDRLMLTSTQDTQATRSDN